MSVYGTRSGYGLRRLVSQDNHESGLVLDFLWIMQANADHYSFFQQGVPVVFFHTGLHPRYHQPTDDASHVDAAGMERVARLVFAVALDLANRPAAPRFRAAACRENEDDARRMTQGEPVAPAPGDPPPRLGIAWRVDDAEPQSVVLCHVAAGSPAAAAGLRVGDRIYQIAGRDFSDDDAFAKMAKTLPGPLDLLVERNGHIQVITVRIAAAAGAAKKAA